MSEKQFKNYVDKELRRLNEVIDFNIIHGLSYKQEAKRHKALIKQRQKDRYTDFFKKIASFVF